MNLIKQLNTPFPQNLKRWKVIFFVSLFISLFLWLFQPFGLQTLDHEYKDLILIGYGLVTFVILIFNLILIPKVFYTFYQDENWTILKEILHLSWIIISIGIGNYFYSYVFSIIPWIGINGILVLILDTFFIAIIPITITIIIRQNVHLKQNIKHSHQINSHISDYLKEPANTKLILQSGNQQLHFNIDEIIFFESEGNYINIHYLENQILKSKLIRNTLKNIEERLSDKTFFKSHRAFIINTSFIEKVKGNSQGLSVQLINIEKEIPVSRSNIKEFKELMNSN